jgi:hypothetical protein
MVSILEKRIRDMTDDTIVSDSTPKPSPAPHHSARNRRLALVAGVAGAMVVFGAAALALRPDSGVSLTPIQPIPIGATAVKGDVAEIFGNKFIVQDGTGRTLVETGREGEGRTLVAKGEPVQVQGRFEDGFLHAAALTHGDGKRVVIGPLGAPPSRLDHARERLGLWPQADIAGLTALVQSAGYSDIRVAGRGPRHLDVVAKTADGKDHDLHVGFDGLIREREAL